MDLPSDGKGGLPKWMLWGGAAASILGLVVFLSKQQSGVGSTVAAGTSINAALGSLQEQLLQTQGEIGTTAAQQNTNLAAVSTQIQSDAAGTQQAIQAATNENMANFTAILAGGGDSRVAAWEQASGASTTQSNASFDAGANTAAQLTAAATGTH
jgi:hypothetical protein